MADESNLSTANATTDMTDVGRCSIGDRQWVFFGMYYPPTDVTHPTTNPAAHSQESNLPPVDHKSNSITSALVIA